MATISVADFKKYTAKARKAYQQKAAVFLAELSAAKNEAAIKAHCEKTLSNIRSSYKKPNTQNVIVTAYRNSLRSYQADIELNASNSFDNPNGESRDVFNGRTHYALSFLKLGKETHVKRNEATQAKTQQQRTHGQPFNPFKVIEVAEAALNSDSYLEVAVGVEFLIGRRHTEVLKAEGFAQVGRFEIEFSGQLKKKAGEAKPYIIYTLIESSRVIDALVRLQREGSLKELDNEANLSYERRRNSSMNAAVRRVYKDALTPPAGEKLLSNKNLRAAYTQAAAVLFKSPTESMSNFAQRILGHKGVSSTISYEDYVCLDEAGNEIQRGQRWGELGQKPATPKTEKRTTITIDGQLKERFDSYGEGTQKEKLNQLLNDSARVKTLEANILELERALKKAAQANAPKDAIATAEAATDWAEMPSAELKGSQVPGSAEEKIRRAIEAIQEYNSGKALEEMYRLSQANVRYLSGSRHGTVKTYFATHPELNEYNDGYGFSLQHDRGKTPIADVIKW